MGLKSKMILLASIGFSLGMIISAVIMCFLNGDVITIKSTELLFQLIGPGLYGAIAMGGTVVYDIEDWSLIRSTLTHYIMTFASFFAASTILGWFDGISLLFAFIGFTVSYIIIWIIEYTAWRKEIRKMNEDLNEMIMMDKIDHTDDEEIES